MSCLEYRRSLLAHGAETDEMVLHRMGCAACAGALAEHARFESRLRSGLEVPVPAGLASRVARARDVGRRRFAAAASIAATAVAAGIYEWRTHDDPLALACIEFVIKDEAESIMMGAMPRDEADRALATSLPPARLERIGQIRHIAPCPFQGSTAYHVVLVVPQGKVTLLIMPDKRLSTRKRATREGMYASVTALRNGSVGVIGTRPEVVDSVAGALRG